MIHQARCLIHVVLCDAAQRGRVVSGLLCVVRGPAFCFAILRSNWRSKAAATRVAATVRSGPWCLEWEREREWMRCFAQSAIPRSHKY